MFWTRELELPGGGLSVIAEPPGVFVETPPFEFSNGDSSMGAPVRRAEYVPGRDAFGEERVLLVLKGDEEVVVGHPLDLKGQPVLVHFLESKPKAEELLESLVENRGRRANDSARAETCQIIQVRAPLAGC
jgi:hypothetical protein